MSKLRDQIGDILSMYIKKDGFDSAWDEINQYGRPDPNEIRLMLKAILKHLDAKED